MDNQKTKPNGWYYGLAALALVLGCLVATAILYPGTRDLPTSISRAHDLNRLTQIIVPGSADLTLSRTGAYAVYYEHHSVVGGVEHIGNEKPPKLECSLALKATGRMIPVVPDFGDQPVFRRNGKRKGKAGRGADHEYHH